MQRGLFIPQFGELAHPRLLADLGQRAERAGWDGLFVWDHIQYRAPAALVLDPWVTLAAVGAVTTRLRLGAMVTPLARRRPWVVARQLAALDLLTDGRMVLGVGLGLDDSGKELSTFGEELDARTRAEMLDEGLEIVHAAPIWANPAPSGASLHRRWRHVPPDARAVPTSHMGRRPLAQPGASQKGGTSPGRLCHQCRLTGRRRAAKCSDGFAETGWRALRDRGGARARVAGAGLGQGRGYVAADAVLPVRCPRRRRWSGRGRRARGVVEAEQAEQADQAGHLAQGNGYGHGPLLQVADLIDGTAGEG